MPAPSCLPRYKITDVHLVIFVCLGFFFKVLWPKSNLWSLELVDGMRNREAPARHM